MNFDMKLNELNIACIYGSSLSDWRGTTAGLKNMLYIFKRLGIKTNLISFSYYSNKFHIEHKKIDSLLNSTAIHLPSYLPNFLKAFAIFLAFSYAWGPAKKSNIIFANLSMLQALPAVILGKVFGKPVILHYIDVDTHPIPDRIYKYIVKNADIVFAISHYLIDKAKGYGCENVVYLPTFVDTDLLSISLNARKEVRYNLRIEDNDIVIGYTGPFARMEGLPILLQVFKNLSKKYPNTKIVILGGKIGRSLTKREDDVPKLIKDLNIADKVIIVPPRPHEEVPTFLSACDITCCAKIDCKENRAANPIKVVEYLSMGLPTVCSSVGEITYTIGNGVDGFLVKPGDVKDLEETLEWIILNPERAKEIGENGRKKAIEKYSCDAIEDTVEKSISEIIAIKKGGKSV